jgi:hypothetical protein
MSEKYELLRQVFGEAIEEGQKLYKQYGTPLVNRVLSALGTDVDPKVAKRAVQQQAKVEGTKPKAVPATAKTPPTKSKATEKSKTPKADKNYAQGSRETVFGSNTGIMPELINAPFAVKQELDDRVAETMYDAANRDRIALGFGVDAGPRVEGPGIYEGINPGSQAQYPVDIQDITPDMATEYVPVGRAISEPSMDLMKAIEGTYGMLTGQKAIAGNKMFYDAPPGSINANELDYGQPIDNDRAQVLLDIQSRLGLDPGAMAIVTSPQGARVPNFGIDPELFKRYIDTAASETGSATPREGFFHGMYEENPFDTDAGRYGQTYLDLIGKRPEFVSSFDNVAPELAAKLRATYRDFGKENQMVLPEYFDEMLSAVAGGGEKELRDLIRRRGYAEGGAVDGVVTGLQDLLEKYA